MAMNFWQNAEKHTNSTMSGAIKSHKSHKSKRVNYHLQDAKLCAWQQTNNIQPQAQKGQKITTAYLSCFCFHFMFNHSSEFSLTID